MPATYVALDRFDHESFPALDVLGPVLRYVVPDGAGDTAYSLIKATVDPGVFVPLHSHADRETFFILSGSLEAYSGSDWVKLHAGDIFDAPSNLPHAWRNTSDEPAQLLIITTPSMASFLKELARPVAEVSPSAPPADRLLQFVESAARHGHWLASRVENRAIGLPID